MQTAHLLALRRSLLTLRAGEGATGGFEKEVSIEKCVGTVLPHLRGKGARMRLKNSLPGIEKGAPGGSNFEPRGVRNGSLEGSGGLPGRLGRQVRLRRAV